MGWLVGLSILSGPAYPYLPPSTLTGLPKGRLTSSNHIINSIFKTVNCDLLGCSLALSFSLLDSENGV